MTGSYLEVLASGTLKSSSTQELMKLLLMALTQILRLTYLETVSKSTCSVEVTLRPSFQYSRLFFASLEVPLMILKILFGDPTFPPTWRLSILNSSKRQWDSPLKKEKSKMLKLMRAKSILEISSLAQDLTV